MIEVSENSLFLVIGRMKGAVPAEKFRGAGGE
jgi:hypothetical protein